MPAPPRWAPPPPSRASASAGRSGPRASRASRWCASCATRCSPSSPSWGRAQRPISWPARGSVLTQVINLVDGLRLDQADADTKGDLFEHVLRQIKQAGELGQFRTPRHVIRTIVEMIDPRVGETIYDPAAGTAGFLMAAYNHMRLANSSPSAIVTSRAGRQAAAARPGRQALGGTGQRAEQRHFLRQRRGPEDGAAEQLHPHAHSDQQRQGKDARSLKVTITLAWQRMAAARTCRSPGSGRARPSIKISCPVTSPSGIA